MVPAGYSLDGGSPWPAAGGSRGSVLWSRVARVARRDAAVAKVVPRTVDGDRSSLPEVEQ